MNSENKISPSLFIKQFTKLEGIFLSLSLKVWSKLFPLFEKLLKGIFFFLFMLVLLPCSLEWRTFCRGEFWGAIGGPLGREFLLSVRFWHVKLIFFPQFYRVKKNIVRRYEGIIFSERNPSLCGFNSQRCRVGGRKLHNTVKRLHKPDE